MPKQVCTAIGIHLLFAKKTPEDLSSGVLSWGNYLLGLKLSFRLTLRLNTRWPGAQSRESGQK